MARPSAAACEWPRRDTSGDILKFVVLNFVALHLTQNRDKPDIAMHQPISETSLPGTVRKPGLFSTGQAHARR
jgi:hypothetical protein